VKGCIRPPLSGADLRNGFIAARSSITIVLGVSHRGVQRFPIQIDAIVARELT